MIASAEHPQPWPFSSSFLAPSRRLGPLPGPLLLPLLPYPPAEPPWLLPFLLLWPFLLVLPFLLLLVLPFLLLLLLPFLLPLLWAFFRVRPWPPPPLLVSRELLGPDPHQLLSQPF